MSRENIEKKNSGSKFFEFDNCVDQIELKQQDFNKNYFSS